MNRCPVKVIDGPVSVAGASHSLSPDFTTEDAHLDVMAEIMR